MSDYISREAAIEAMYKDAEAHPGHTFWVTQHEALRSIPAADVRPNVTGRWLKDHDSCEKAYIDVCSVCGKQIFGAFGFNFCPNCGADMREES